MNEFINIKNYAYSVQSIVSSFRHCATKQVIEIVFSCYFSFLINNWNRTKQKWTEKAFKLYSLSIDWCHLIR